MTRRTYEPWRPRQKAIDLLAHAERIAAEYAAAGYELTLRGLYYRLVAGGILEENSTKAYEQLGYLITRARMAGLFSWSYLTDTGRFERTNSHWETPGSIVDAVAEQFRVDKWEGQPRRVVVWVEKDALSNVVGRACRAEDVPWLACKGYMSASEMWQGAQRIGRMLRAGEAVTMLHLGDHDPSGIDMTRDIEDRLALFLLTDFGSFMRRQTTDGLPMFEVRRIALTMDQIAEHDPPPNPAKLTDSRAHGEDGYIARYGNESWELDALPPEVLDALIREHIRGIRDDEAWQARVDEENEHRATLAQVSNRWTDVVDYLRDSDE